MSTPDPLFERINRAIAPAPRGDGCFNCKHLSRGYERSLGITAGLRWRQVADLSVFAAGRGWSQGMLSALESAKLRGAPYIVIDGSEP